MSQEFTASQVAELSQRENAHIIIEGKVYDVSNFLAEHPGGEEVILDLAGMDATEDFDNVGHSDEAREMLGPLMKGTLAPGSKAATKESSYISTGKSGNLATGERNRVSTTASSSFMPFVAFGSILVAYIIYKTL